MQDTQPPAAQGTSQQSPIFPATVALAQRIVMAGNSPAITLRLVYSAGALFPLDLHHFIGLGAARRDHIDLGALLFTNQSARVRRGEGNLAFLSVRLRLADELPHRFFVGVFVD